MGDYDKIRRSIIEKIKDKFPELSIRRNYNYEFDFDYCIKIPKVISLGIAYETFIEITFEEDPPMIKIDHDRLTIISHDYTTGIQQKFDLADPNFALWKIYREIRQTIKMRDAFANKWPKKSSWR